MSTKEKRDCVRLSVPRVVDFIVKGRVYRGSIENNSDCGVFIKTKGRFSDRYEGRDISMTIESPKFGSEKRTGKLGTWRYLSFSTTSAQSFMISEFSRALKLNDRPL